ncbi:hypothetical protein [Bowmanella sp. JS7-9]|uniref:Beta/Gamma crystallin n=1 Tax=Pseudobowmanella zhangzhouensis TaxID=1537679 RepID=A0ABW1XKL1_9ALTE|nr:hypothetical protein [Bowmanella sp. JS7-9]TBX22126.1 hypothetical protein TK45_09410 [Bowmanella sp. JS7-9]
MKSIKFNFWLPCLFLYLLAINFTYGKGVKFEQLSIIKIVAYPEGFNNKAIVTSGYLIFNQGEGPHYGYWISPFKNFDPYSSIYLGFNDEQITSHYFDGSFCGVSGFFVYREELKSMELKPVDDFIDVYCY